MVKQIGRYQIKRKLGEGGMAVVYLAYDPVVSREVALKLLPTRYLHNPTLRGRFEQEAKTIAKLEHAAIVPVHDFGEHEEQLYLVMRLMSGGSLAQRLAVGPISLWEAEKIVRRIGTALDKAHAKGVIHRDVKPDNILFDEEGEAYLSDFGIAKLKEATAGFTRTSAVIGTPSYMSPEQAKGESELDGRSDIYALGVILFEMLTGQLPYQSQTPVGLALKHLQHPIPRLLDSRPGLPADCQTIINRVLAKQPADRYQEGRLVADALAAIIRGEGLPGVRRAWWQRPRSLLLVAVMLLWLAGAFLVGGRFGLLALRATPPIPAATKEDDLARPTTEATLIAIRPTATATMQAATTTTSATTSIPTSLPAVLPLETATIQPTATEIEAVPTPTSIGRIAFAARQEEDLEIYLINADGSGLVTLTNNEEDDYEPAWSPDGSQLTFTSNRDKDFDIYLMEADGGHVTRLTESAPFDGGAAWSPDGRQLAFTSEQDGDYEIFLLDVESGQRTQLTFNEVADYGPSWSPNGRRLVYTSDFGGAAEIYVMDADGTDLTRLTDNQVFDSSPAWSPEADQIAFVSDRDGNFEIYVMEIDGEGQTRLTTDPADDNRPCWSPDGTRLAFVSNRGGDYEIYVMNQDGSEPTALTTGSKVETSTIWVVGWDQ